MGVRRAYAPGVALEVRRFETAAALGQSLARHLAEVAGRGPCLIGWPAGRTPGVVVDGLVELAGAGRLDLRHVVLVLMDEYLDASGALVPEAAEYSCRGFVARQVVAPLNAALAPGRRLREVWHPEPSGPEAYDHRIADAGGIDVFVVASGSSDGHVALLGPGSDPAGRTSVVRLAETTRQDNLRTFPAFGDLSAVPTHGVSVGLGTISAARELAVVMHGSEKRVALERLLTADAYDPSWPATIALEHPVARLWLDAAALEP